MILLTIFTASKNRKGLIRVLNDNLDKTKKSITYN